MNISHALPKLSHTTRWKLKAAAVLTKKCQSRCQHWITKNRINLLNFGSNRIITFVSKSNSSTVQYLIATPFIALFSVLFATENNKNFRDLSENTPTNTTYLNGNEIINPFPEIKMAEEITASMKQWSLDDLVEKSGTAQTKTEKALNWGRPGYLTKSELDVYVSFIGIAKSFDVLLCCSRKVRGWSIIQIFSELLYIWNRSFLNHGKHELK